MERFSFFDLSSADFFNELLGGGMSYNFLHCSQAEPRLIIMRKRTNKKVHQKAFKLAWVKISLKLEIYA